MFPWIVKVVILHDWLNPLRSDRSIGPPLQTSIGLDFVQSVSLPPTTTQCSWTPSVLSFAMIFWVCPSSWSLEGSTRGTAGWCLWQLSSRYVQSIPTSFSKWWLQPFPALYTATSPHLRSSLATRFPWCTGACDWWMSEVWRWSSWSISKSQIRTGGQPWHLNRRSSAWSTGRCT